MQDVLHMADHPTTDSSARSDIQAVIEATRGRRLTFAEARQRALSSLERAERERAEDVRREGQQTYDYRVDE
jgi:hypothetical protein